MKQKYLLPVAISVWTTVAIAQITGPASGPVGAPVNFSLDAPGSSHNWSIGTAVRNVDPAQFAPVATRVAGAGTLPNFTSMVFDGTNWYSFSILATSGVIVRADYGADPSVNTVPTTNLGVTIPAVSPPPNNVTKGIDVVYDSTDKRWFAVIATGWLSVINILDFGTAGLNNPNPTLINVPTNAANNFSTNQLTMKRENGQWLCFIGGGGASGGLCRYDLGPNLGALTASSAPLVQHLMQHVSNTGVLNFSLHKEDGKWYAIASTCDGGLVILTVSSQDTGLSYLWKNGTATIPLAGAYFLEIGEARVYTVVAGRAQIAGCEDTTNEVRVTVHPLPVADITWDNLLLHATPGYAGYQWHIGIQDIPGVTDSIFQPSASGDYSVTVTDSNGFSTKSSVIRATVGVEEMILNRQVNVFPNPANDIVYIEGPAGQNLMLSSMDGKLLFEGSGLREINIRDYADGIYILRISDKMGYY